MIRNAIFVRLRLAAPAAALALMMSASGCGHALPSDAGTGREVLRDALDAWKGGEKPDQLAKRTPPIHVTDGEWMSGLRLESYKAEDGGKLIGTDVNYAVVLELKDSRGKVTKRDAVYAVTTRPTVLVVRLDSL